MTQREDFGETVVAALFFNFPRSPHKNILILKWKNGRIAKKYWAKSRLKSNNEDLKCCGSMGSVGTDSVMT